jgi:hypothetical protein
MFVRNFPMKVAPSVAFTLTALVGLLLLGSGCASGYTRGPGAQPATAMMASATRPISSVEIKLTDEVKARLKNSLRFDQEALQRSVELALSNRHIFDQQKKEGTRNLHITITHVRVRNTFNAVMWGFMSGNDSINGDVELKDQTGATLDTFHIDTSYALGGYAGGQDSARMNWLYEAFAKQVVTALLGEEKKS